MSEKQSAIGRFFGGIWRGVTWLRVGLSNLLFLLVIALLVIALNGGGPGRPLDTNTALLLNPVGVMVEERRRRW